MYALHLHSTMYLLNHGRIVDVYESPVDLHSTMYLLNRV